MMHTEYSCCSMLAPARRLAGSPFLSVAGSPFPLAPFINTAALQLEAALNRNLFPIHLEYTDLQQLISSHCKAAAGTGVGQVSLAADTAAVASSSGEASGGGGVAWVVFEVSTGRMVVGSGAQEQHSLRHLPDKSVKVMQQLSRQLFLSMADLVGEVRGGGARGRGWWRWWGEGGGWLCVRERELEREGCVVSTIDVAH
jgi:hypothetical protein